MSYIGNIRSCRERQECMLPHLDPTYNESWFAVWFKRSVGSWRCQTPRFKRWIGTCLQREQGVLAAPTVMLQITSDLKTEKVDTSSQVAEAEYQLFMIQYFQADCSNPLEGKLLAIIKWRVNDIFSFESGSDYATALLFIINSPSIHTGLIWSYTSCCLTRFNCHPWLESSSLSLASPQWISRGVSCSPVSTATYTSMLQLLSRWRGKNVPRPLQEGMGRSLQIDKSVCRCSLI